MSVPAQEARDDLAAVLHTAQYLTMMLPDTDVWPEFARIMARFFDADLVAVLERSADRPMTLRFSSLESGEGAALVDRVRETARQVLDSGFLASEVIAGPEPLAIALLPLRRDQKTEAALLIGHHGESPLPQPRLNVYLAVAGLLESTLARLAEQRQRQITALLQEGLLHPLPEIAGLELGRVSQSAYEPDLVGGDFSEVFAIDETRVAIAIGDVEGKGVRAAGLAETVSSAIAAFSLIDSSPAFVLGKSNELLLRRNGHAPQAVTVFLLVLDVVSGSVTFASAGHPAAMLLGTSSCAPLEGASRLPLGVLQSDYSEDAATLAAGDCLVLYTDGVTEARRGGELFGEERLAGTLRRLSGAAPAAVAEGLRDATVAFAGELRDDLQILVVRRAAAG